MIPKYSQVFKW